MLRSGSTKFSFLAIMWCCSMSIESTVGGWLVALDFSPGYTSVAAGLSPMAGVCDMDSGAQLLIAGVAVMLCTPTSDRGRWSCLRAELAASFRVKMRKFLCISGG